VILEVPLKIFSRNELSMETKWNSVRHLETRHLFIRFSVVQNEVASFFDFIIGVAADVYLIISGANNCWLSSNLVLALIDCAVQT
jgi:hypothetical protein